MDRDAKDILAQIYRSAVAAADPYSAVKENLLLRPGSLVIGGTRYGLPDIRNIYVIGAGKAVYGMARAAEEVLGELITDGAVVTKDGHGGPLEYIELYEASHPLPDARGLSAASRILEIAASAGPDDLVVCLLSGGASALMVLPAPGVTLEDKQAATRLLLSSGADIGEVNCVRKHLSSIKGGRLAEAAYPARVATLIISDVLGDDIGTIASGPTAPDDTTYLQAKEILLMRGVYDRMPEAVRALLEDGCIGTLQETPKPSSEIFGRVDNLAIAFSLAALKKAEEVSGLLGYNSAILDDAVKGEAREAASRIADEAVRCRTGGVKTPACLIVGGETTVTIKGNGLGGRNQEMALGFALKVQGIPGVYALFAGTDGTDGPTDAAGAFANGNTVFRAHKAGLDALSYLQNNDSYHFFKALDDLFVTGPTGTNVMDIGIILII